MRHNPRRRFSQNFLIETEVVEKIIRALNPRPEEVIFEIGAGSGVLTKPLAALTDNLHAIEIDRDLIEDLKKIKNLQLYSGDVLNFDLTALPAPFRVVGNLPYHISSLLIFRLVGFRKKIIDMTLMLQREVAERITASQNHKNYGRLSVMIQSLFQVETLFLIDAASFHPKPKVESALVRFTPLTKPLPCDFENLQKIVKSAFSMRRKKLKNCLKFIHQADTRIDLEKRAEMLRVADFIALTKDYEKQQR